MLLADETGGEWANCSPKVTIVDRHGHVHVGSRILQDRHLNLIFLGLVFDLILPL